EAAREDVDVLVSIELELAEVAVRVVRGQRHRGVQCRAHPTIEPRELVLFAELLDRLDEPATATTNLTVQRLERDDARQEAGAADDEPGGEVHEAVEPIDADTDEGTVTRLAGGGFAHAAAVGRGVRTRGSLRANRVDLADFGLDRDHRELDVALLRLAEIA